MAPGSWNRCSASRKYLRLCPTRQLLLLIFCCRACLVSFQSLSCHFSFWAHSAFDLNLAFNLFITSLCSQSFFDLTLLSHCSWSCSFALISCSTLTALSVSPHSQHTMYTHSLSPTHTMCMIKHCAVPPLNRIIPSLFIICNGLVCIYKFSRFKDKSEQFWLDF